MTWPPLRQAILWVPMVLASVAQADPDLRADLGRLLVQPPFAHALWGIQIAPLREGTVLFETNSHLLLKPASNAKLFTGALVLDQFGPDHRIVTSLYASTPPDPQGHVAGDLVIYGRGDPSLASRYRQGDAAQSLRPLVQVIDSVGIRFVKGDLVGDETFFQGPPFGASWTWSDLNYYYGAEISALSSDDNVIDLTLSPGPEVGDPGRIQAVPAPHGLRVVNRTRTVPATFEAWQEVLRLPGERIVHVTGELPLGGADRMDAMTVPQPGQWFMHRLRHDLENHGVRVAGQTRLRTWLAPEDQDGMGLVELARVTSPPMRELVRGMMKPSQNLHAHLLWLQAGAALPVPSSGPRPATTSRRGRMAMDRFLTRMGIDAAQVQLNEGSGLSRDALVTPSAIVQLLRRMRTHQHADAFLEALPVSGVDGTLQRRLADEEVRGVVLAKTGTLRHVLALSGYIEPPGGEPLVFSILLNQFAGEPHEGRRVIDEVVARLVRHSRQNGSTQRGIHRQGDTAERARESGL